MATLQKIRNHGGLLIAIVGLAMLAFILGDFLNSGSSFFNRSRENIAEIEGQSVHYTEYEAAREQLTEVYKIETGRSDFDEDLSAQIRNQVWSMLLMDYTLRAQAQEIGMDVTADELSELCIGANPHQIIRARRAFFDENGQFSRENLVRFLASLEQEVEDPSQAANIEQAKNYWLYWENAVRLTRMQDKYTALVKGLVRANSLDAEYAFEAQQKSVDVAYVLEPYYAVADSLVSVRTADIKKLYKLHHSQYKQTPNRAIEYITFPIVPSEEDYTATKKLMEDLYEEFTTSEDIALVVNPNSDIMYDGRDYSEETIPAQFKEFAFRKGAKVGDVTEIEFLDGTYAMARIMACGYNLPDSVELKAIAPKAAEGQPQREDQELGWFQASELQAAIAEPAFHSKRGTRFTVAQGMGEQEFEVLEISKATPKVKLAILSREVTPSSKTYSVLYNKAKQFIVANNTAEALRAAAQEAGMTVKPQYNLDKNTDKVADLKSSRPIVRWAFEAKEGQVSDVFECGDKFVVAALTEVADGDYKSLEAVRPELLVEATNNKKAELLTKDLKAYASLEEAAKALGHEVQHADKLTLSSFRLGNGAQEPAVIGAALAIKPGKLSQPIQGQVGVYLIQTSNAQNAGGEFKADEQKQQINARYGYQIPYQAIALMENQAKVTDNRANFQ